MKWVPVVVALIAASITASADDVVGSLRADLDLDGKPDDVRVRCAKQPGPAGDGEFRIEVKVGDRTWSFDVTHPDGLVKLREAQESFPAPIQPLQKLHRDPLAVYDINGDGLEEVVAHFKVPLSHTSHHMVILGWDAEAGECVQLFSDASDQWLLMDARGTGGMVLLAAYVHGLPQWGGCREVPTVADRGDGEWQHRVPKELAARVLPVYAEALAQSPSKGQLGEIARQLRLVSESLRD